MRKRFFSIAVFAAVALTAGWNYQQNKQKAGLSDLALENIEALASGETSGSYGCGYAAYEWDDDWYEDTKNFTKCKSGCPEGSGTSPKYIKC